MKRIALALALVALAAPALAAQPRTYQVTGPVLEITADTITVQKGSEKWEIARTADTKVKGELKTGEKVTVHYKMTATSVEVAGKKK
jgi:cytochrome c1